MVQGARDRVMKASDGRSANPGGDRRVGRIDVSSISHIINYDIPVVRRLRPPRRPHSRMGRRVALRIHSSPQKNARTDANRDSHQSPSKRDEIEGFSRRGNSASAGAASRDVAVAS